MAAECSILKRRTSDFSFSANCGSLLVRLAPLSKKFGMFIAKHDAFIKETIRDSGDIQIMEVQLRYCFFFLSSE